MLSTLIYIYEKNEDIFNSSYKMKQSTILFIFLDGNFKVLMFNGMHIETIQTHDNTFFAAEG